MSRLKRRLWFYGTLVVSLVAFGIYATAMPGASHTGPLPKQTSEGEELANRLQSHVVALSQTIGERRVGHGASLEQARDYLTGVAGELAAQGRLVTRREDVGADGSNAENVILELPGASARLIIVGAHYDSAVGAPGADDNASGVASSLEIARALCTRNLAKTLRFVLFANEEPPYFQNPGMGSLAHARGCRERGEQVDAMLSLESIGYFSDSPGSQSYPWPVGLFYPDRGNFLGFVGNLSSRSLVRRTISTFRESASFPSEGAALPATIPGVDWSDHWAFWESGYPAIMVTGTATFRNPHYHRSTDRADTLDYSKLARVTQGLTRVVEALANH